MVDEFSESEFSTAFRSAVAALEQHADSRPLLQLREHGLVSCCEIESLLYTACHNNPAASEQLLAPLSGSEVELIRQIPETVHKLLETGRA